jgi:hypothetical protein
MKILTAAQIAEQIDRSARTVSRLAAAHGVGIPHGRGRIFNAGDVTRLRKIIAEQEAETRRRQSEAGKRFGNGKAAKGKTG